jgi:hypothetical protein
MIPLYLIRGRIPYLSIAYPCVSFLIWPLLYGIGQNIAEKLPQYVNDHTFSIFNEGCGSENEWVEKRPDPDISDDRTITTIPVPELPLEPELLLVPEIPHEPQIHASPPPGAVVPLLILSPEAAIGGPSCPANN